VQIVLTLVAGPDGRAALSGRAAAIAEALGAAGPVWLGEEEACDLILDRTCPEPAEAVARAILGDAPIDVLVQPAAGRRKHLLVADLEATIIENEMLDDLGALLGRGPQIAAITRRAMDGEIDFTAALEARVALLAGMERWIVEQAAAGIRLTPGSRALVATMRRAGAYTALVSGGFTLFAEPIARALGFDHVVANRLEYAGSRLSGRVLPPILTGETKRQTLLSLVARHGLSPGDTLAVGDGANDLPMLGAAGLGVAFHARSVVAAAVRSRIDHADLSALLYAQGYSRDEFAGGPCASSGRGEER
jgi:phosphoserine phosphatase